MSPVLRMHATGVAVLALVAPVAYANDLRPTRPNSEPSNAYGPKTDSFRAPTQMGMEIAGDRPTMDAIRRGQDYTASGQRALQKSDNDKACKFFEKAHKAFSSKKVDWGIAQSEEFMSRACTA